MLRTTEGVCDCVQLKRKKTDSDEADEEERALSVIANLFQGLPRGSRRDRLAAKFVESEFEKCDRLIELFDRYQKRVQIAEVHPSPTHHKYESPTCSPQSTQQMQASTCYGSISSLTS